LFILLGLASSLANSFTVRRFDQYPPAEKYPFYQNGHRYGGLEKPPVGPGGHALVVIFWCFGNRQRDWLKGGIGRAKPPLIPSFSFPLLAIPDGQNEP
jgi:hypothetical protein